MTTIVTWDDTACDRCDADLVLSNAVPNHVLRGLPARCPKCGLEFEVDDTWLKENSDPEPESNPLPTRPIPAFPRFGGYRRYRTVAELIASDPAYKRGK